jgi:NAD(P)-dependent dehydrogenase (short-subunit alcohol dehydrogenase family)
VSVDRTELAVCLSVLARLGDPGLDDATRLELERAVTAAARDVKRRAKVRRDGETRAADRAVLAAATRFHTEIPPVLPGPAPAVPAPAGTLRRERRCYVCKTAYREVDADYHLLCPPCAEENRVRRHARCDLSGRTAIVTGGRVKIGFHTALKLLRDGAEVVVTTRFPRDAARRYAAVPDFASWGHRLSVHELDLLDLNATLEFVALAGRRFAGLDILVNNAAQTLYRPQAYHREVRAAETAALSGPAARIAITAGRPSVPATSDDPLFPAGQRDETGQQLDLREVNSWVLHDGDVSPHEWLQVHVVNAFAPFLLTSRLRPLLAAARQPQRHVVQVSAMEGSFSRRGKTVRHPHTNMAKASLNMLVRTVAADYARDGIHMNSVDTGWVTDERPHPAKTAVREAGFRPPLDVVDGAARVYDPIVRGVRGAPVSGQFLKDYRSVPW